MSVVSRAEDYRSLRSAAAQLRLVEGGLQRGNDDLAESCQWTPPAAPEKAPLPGHEHSAGLAGRTWRDAA